MKIIVTGGSGFVGQNLIKFLSKLNFNLYSLDRFKLQHFELSDNINGIIHLAGKAHDLKNVSLSDDYYKVNTEITKQIFDKFLVSNSKFFILISSVKAVADHFEGTLKEEENPNPQTHYGRSKLLAERYILSHNIPNGKRVYILRPCMIHGPGNKGNLNLLYKLVSKGIPWPLGNYSNSRSYLSIDNLCFIIKELINSENIPSGVYNVADDIPLSTNEVIQIIAQSNGKNAKLLNINKSLIIAMARFGDYLKFSFNSERLMKLTESYIVCNDKITKAIGKSLPVSSKEGLLKTFQSFSTNV